MPYTIRDLCKRIELSQGDCLKEMEKLSSNYVDAIITDPPYGLNFMNKNWDRGIPGVSYWLHALRVLKPGGHLLSFGGTRTFHRLACVIEDAGFEIRDTIMWIYGSGFPKSLDVSKAIDKMKGVERKEIGIRTDGRGRSPQKILNHDHGDTGIGHADGSKQVYMQTIPATNEAKQWEGWGTALKPAYEPIILARKPLDKKTVAENVLEHGTGAINIDACRVESNGDYIRHGVITRKEKLVGDERLGSSAGTNHPSGRWPTNVIHDGSDEVVGLFPETQSGKQGKGGHKRKKSLNYSSNVNFAGRNENAGILYGDSGSAARFFYTAKATANERTINGLVANSHPTVKPIKIMEYLIKLVTIKDAIILDPFMGSGSTGLACINLDRKFIGIELDANNYLISKNRILATIKNLVESRRYNET